MLNTLIESFETWTSAQGIKSKGRVKSIDNISLEGIARLRELILEFALRGKLLTQKANEESAAFLLQKIEKERKKVLGAKGKAFSELPSILENELPFDPPIGWKFERIGNLMELINGKAFKPTDWSTSGLPIIRIQNLNDSNASFNYCDFDVDDRYYVENNDLLIGWSGTPGTSFGAFVWERGNAVLNQHIFKVKQFGRFISVEFLKLAINSRLNEMISKAHGGVGLQHITKAKFELILLPLPPVLEQKRIVAKVDELMALCDQLEEVQTRNLSTHQALVTALLQTLTQAADSNELQQAWQRLEPHFDTLFCTEDSIDQLKQTILQLAIMGRLVPQDPKDEPASVLLKKISAEKAKLVAAGKLKKEKPLPEIKEAEKQFELPKGWEWVKFGKLSSLINGDRSKNYPHTSEYVAEGIAWINTGHIEPTGKLSESEMNFISREKFDSLRSGKIEKGDLVYCLRGATFGKTAFVEPYMEGAIASSLMIIRPHLSELRDFIYNYLVSPFAKKQLLRFDNGSAQPNLSANSVGLYAFPLPPILEQSRIVSKVNDLMKLCDSLKSRLAKAQDLQNALAVTVVEQAVG